MDRHRLAAVVAVALLALAGCGGAVDETTEPPTATQTESPARTATPSGPTTTDPGGTTPTEPNGTNRSLVDGSLVVDLGPEDVPAIEGGITVPPDGQHTPTYYTTLLSGTDRLNESVLPGSAVEFVENTDFETATVVAVQAYPKSSVPDYRVESVTESNGRLDIRINDSARVGTDDITLETVLLRVDHNGPAPEFATVTTQNGVTFDTSDGLVTVEQDPESDGDTDTSLPLKSPNESDNVEYPRDLTVDNDGSETHGYTVSVSEDGETVFERSGKVRPGESITYEDLIAKWGEYDVTVEAELGGEETVTDSFEWKISSTYHGAFVSIGDDDVSITQDVE